MFSLESRAKNMLKLKQTRMKQAHIKKSPLKVFFFIFNMVHIPDFREKSNILVENSVKHTSINSRNEPLEYQRIPDSSRFERSFPC